MKKRKPTIGVLGLWHLGCVYASALAELGYQVTGYDLDRQTVDHLKQGTPPIFEPDLANKLSHALGKNLFFTKSQEEAIGGKKYIFVTLDIPVNDQDETDLKPLNKLLTAIKKYASPHSTVVISSQIPLGTCRNFLKKIDKSRAIKVIYFPENLRLGTAFQTFLKPDRIILGLEDKTLLRQFMKDFSNFTCPVLSMSLESAEMVKHALNSFLAVSISFASEISDLCELLGANYDDVIKALKTDGRVGVNAPLNPGTGFAGGTIGRDVQTLKKLAKKRRYQPGLIDTAYEINQGRLTRLAKRIQRIYPKLFHKRIGILGLTYKPDTNTLRRSKSLELAALLNQKQALVMGYDPTIKAPIASHPYIRVAPTLKDFFLGLDAIIIMTPCPEFREIEPKTIMDMRRKTVFDTVNILDKNKFATRKIKYFRTGQ